MRNFMTVRLRYAAYSLTTLPAVQTLVGAAAETIRHLSVPQLVRPGASGAGLTE